MDSGITTFNVLDIELTDRSLILHCEKNRAIMAEKSNAEFLLNKWDKKGNLICEIPSWEPQSPEAVNIPAVVMKRLRIIVEEETRQGVKPCLNL